MVLSGGRGIQHKEYLISRNNNIKTISSKSVEEFGASHGSHIRTDAPAPLSEEPAHKSREKGAYKRRRFRNSIEILSRPLSD